MKLRKLIMIVNPQLFNYRLIISSLLVVLTVLGVYSFTKYKSIASYEEFLKQEKVLIETELSDLLSSYDGLSQDYNFMASKLQEAKFETKNVLDSLRLLNSDLSIITRFKSQLIVLKSKSKVLLTTIDSLNSSNIKLQREKDYALNTIKKKASTITELEDVNDLLHKSIDNAAVLKASHIEVIPYKFKSGKKRFIDRARRVNTFDVCISLHENPLAQKGKKNVYIQIVSPQGNVVSDKGEVVFGEASLNYSKKEEVTYANNNLDVCTSIKTTAKEKPLLKGTYFIHVFNENMKLGSTSLELN